MGIFDFLRKTAHELGGVPEDEIRPESTTKELNLDMFDREELVLDAEEQYDVFLNDPKFETLDDLAKLIDIA